MLNRYRSGASSVGGSEWTEGTSPRAGMTVRAVAGPLATVYYFPRMHVSCCCFLFACSARSATFHWTRWRTQTPAGWGGRGRGAFIYWVCRCSLRTQPATSCLQSRAWAHALQPSATASLAPDASHQAVSRARARLKRALPCHLLWRWICGCRGDCQTQVLSRCGCSSTASAFMTSLVRNIGNFARPVRPPPPHSQPATYLRTCPDP